MTDSEPTPDIRPPSTLLPRLSIGEWIVFAILAGVIAAANIYTTLLIGWGDTGSIVAVISAVAMLSVVGRRASVYQINLGQTMVSAGGGVGFAVASYAAIHLVRKDWDPNPYFLVLLFMGTGVLGAIVGNAVRKQMVRLYFPSGTACAVIQRAVTGDRDDPRAKRPVKLLKISSLVAAAITIPAKIALEKGAGAIFSKIPIALGLHRLPSFNLPTDPLYYGIGLVVGPRIGLGMIIGGLATPFVIQPLIESATASGEAWGTVKEWSNWMAIAVLTLPTFATIAFALAYKTPAIVPSGFTPEHTRYTRPRLQQPFHMLLLVLGVSAASLAGHFVFGIAWYATALIVAIAIPLSLVNGRVAGETDINPVRLVAILLLSAFFWLVESDVTALIGMAVVGATIASIAVDIMQDYRTGYLLDQDPAHQTSIQFFGVAIGAIVSVPVLTMLIGKLGIGEGSTLPAPGAQIWAEVANGIAGEVSFSNQLLWAVAVVSLLGIGYAFLTVNPKTSPWMPSLFGIGLGLLLPIGYCVAIFLGGAMKWAALTWVRSTTAAEQRDEKTQRAGDDTMIVGASIFAAGAVLSILLVLFDVVFDAIGWHPWFLAG